MSTVSFRRRSASTMWRKSKRSSFTDCSSLTQGGTVSRDKFLTQCDTAGGRETVPVGGVDARQTRTHAFRIGEQRLGAPRERSDVDQLGEGADDLGPLGRPADHEYRPLQDA